MEITTIQDNLLSLGISMFVPISPNINWLNNWNWTRTLQVFRRSFNQVNLSAMSSSIGLDPLYLHKNLVGGSTILTFGLWASKVSQSFHDTSGHGIFSISTIQGKGNKCISFIAAYISVQKGSNIGTESVFTQQRTIYEKDMKRKGLIPCNKFCPRANAIKLLDQIISVTFRKNKMQLSSC